RGHAVENFGDAARTQREHAVPDCGELEIGRRRSTEHHLFEVVVEAHDLVERYAALVARVVADAAALSLHELAVRLADLLFAEADVFEGFALDRRRGFALHAHATRETLRENE